MSASDLRGDGYRSACKIELVASIDIGDDNVLTGEFPLYIKRVLNARDQESGTPGLYRGGLRSLISRATRFDHTIDSAADVVEEFIEHLCRGSAGLSPIAVMNHCYQRERNVL